MLDEIQYAYVPAIHGDPMCFWHESEAECEDYEAEENAIKEKWRTILGLEGFVGLLAKASGSNFGKFITLTPSSRQESALQMTFYDNKGPVRHDTYSMSDKLEVEKMFDELCSLSREGDIKVRFHIAEN